MSAILELRYRKRYIVGPLVGIVVIAYIAYHGISGERGLIAWRIYDQRVLEARSQLEKVESERKTLERDVMLLHPTSVDPDMLDEWARRVINYGRSGEFIIFTDLTTE